jgi:hypothetical protein
MAVSRPGMIITREEHDLEQSGEGCARRWTADSGSTVPTWSARARFGPFLAITAIAAIAMIAYATHGHLWGVRTPPARTAGTPAPGPAAPRARIVQLSLDDALPLIALHRGQLPAPLASQASEALAAAWPAWVTEHNREIHTRLAQGDEESIVNLWLFGTSFTNRPRATAKDVAALGSRERAEDLLIDRLDDLVSAIAAPAAN